jgi:septal ring-binding cell division protein DamX
MTKRRNHESGAPARGILDERRRLIAAGSLSAAVIFVLVFGAILRTDAPFAEMTVPVAEPPSTMSATDGPVRGEREATSSPEPRTRPSAATPARRRPQTSASLGERAAADLDRLVASGGSYTLQLMVSCDLANARRNLDLIGNTSRLYVLPVELDGKDCYRLCWGDYATRESAENAADLPASFDAPRVRPVGELTP